jgi:2-polyprenyl-3-methyl-5-hydroxy-6-metoxy-1,4-benzoquinol methylase
MPLGDIAQYDSKALHLDVLLKLFGVLDLHSHIRWWAIKEYIDKMNKNADIGAGWGIMSFEFVKATSKSIDCVEVDPKLIQLGRTLAAKLGTRKIRFIRDSLPKLSKLERNYYDQILLIDVLEHVKEDLESLIRINSLLRREGILIISVPTPNYPKYFGQRFANAIGHVREGYTIKDVEKLLKMTGFEIIKWSYHTNFLSPYLCKLWYNCTLSSKLKIILFPFLRTLGRLDFIGKGINSCGIAIKARKVSDIIE